jgi:hypothetical protein
MGLIPCKCEDLKNEYVKLDKLLHTLQHLFLQFTEQIVN